jgi:hypothetical protein
VVEVARVFTADYSAAGQYYRRLEWLEEVHVCFAREEASPFPKQTQQVDDHDRWLQVVEECLEAINGNERLLQAKSEPLSEKRGHLLQCMAATVLGVLPGLAKLMLQTRGWRSPRGMVAHPRAVTLQPTVHQHGFAATILNYFIFPVMLHRALTCRWRRSPSPSSCSCDGRRSPRP